MSLEHLLVFLAYWGSVCGQAVKKSHICGIAILRRSSRMYFGVSFLLCTGYVLAISYKWTTLRKKIAFSFFFHIFQKCLEKNEPFKTLIMPHRLYMGVLAFQNGVILWAFPLSRCSRAFKSVIGSQQVRCVIYAPRTPDGAPCILGLCMWPGCEKVPHMWYRHTQEE